MNSDKPRSKALAIVVVICATVVALSAVGAFVYVNQQNITQKNTELKQQKELKEKELESQERAARTQADGQKGAARCMSGSSTLWC